MGTKGSYDFEFKTKQYRKHTDAMLAFAVKDAAEARDLTATFDEKASLWYCDDVCTIATEIQRRKKALATPKRRRR